MEVKISTSNSKMGYEIPSVSISREHSCRPDAPCFRQCYASKGNLAYPQAVNARQHNYELYCNNSDVFFGDIIHYLRDKLVSHKYFRWHVVGDLVDDNYFAGVVLVAKKCKGTKFLCFTKKFDIVNRFVENGGTIPSNLKIVFSAWSNLFKVENPHNFPVAYVFFKNNALNPEIPPLAIPCSGSCPECLACWSLKKGQSVVFNQH